MTLRFSIIIYIVISVLNLIRADGDGGHHHVIIHVPYKIHTIHHTIMKHIHHHKGEDKYEVLGYTVGKPIELGHHFGDGGGGGHEQLHHHELAQHDFGGGNELGHGHEWTPSYGQHDFAGAGGGGGHGEGHAESVSHHEYIGHGGYGGYE